VIDNSSPAHGPGRAPGGPEVNESTLRAITKGIVANPTARPCGHAGAEAAARRRRAHPSGGLDLPGGVGSGLAGVAELDEQLRATVDGAAASPSTAGRVRADASVFPDRIAHNVLSIAGSLVDDGSGETNEEQKFRTRAARSRYPGPGVTCTCVRVPVFTGHSLAIVAEFAGPLAPDEATKLLDGAAGVELSDLRRPPGDGHRPDAGGAHP